MRGGAGDGQHRFIVGNNGTSGYYAAPCRTISSSSMSRSTTVCWSRSSKLNSSACYPSVTKRGCKGSCLCASVTREYSLHTDIPDSETALDNVTCPTDNSRISCCVSFHGTQGQTFHQFRPRAQIVMTLSDAPLFIQSDFCHSRCSDSK